MNEVERRRSVTERILVFKGDEVIYDAFSRQIICASGDDCFRIENVDPKDVRELRATILVYGALFARVRGKELWSDGEKWIIKG